jgi:signal transduction histidine kinase
MDFILHAWVLDEIFPFSFIVDSAGRLVWLGRSLPKVAPEATAGSLYQEHFCVEQPTLGMHSFAPDSLVGEFVKLSVPQGTGVALRGQVVALRLTEERYLFSLIPDVTQAASLEASGLDFGDFALSEPIIDRMILWRLFKQTRESLETANAGLLWRDLGTQLLHSLSAEIFPQLEDLDILSTGMKSVSKTLGWDVGRVFIVPETENRVLKLSSASFISDLTKFSSFNAQTEQLTFPFGEGLPGRAADLRSIQWVQDVTKDPLSAQRSALIHIRRLTGVAVPIVVDDQVLAVMELFTERVFSNPDGVVRLLEIVRRQLEAHIGRQHARRREREQESLLIHSSKMATLGELAAEIAHEIRSPLSAISMTAELLSRMEPTSPANHSSVLRHALRVKECVAHIARIVADLQSFSRDTTRDPMSECKVADIVATTLHLCGTKFTNQKVELKVDEIPEHWVVTCRAPQVSQVLLNLISNAYDAAMQGGEHWVRLSISEEGDFFTVSVSDSGPGVPEEVQKKMMLPFYTTKAPGKGTGLGLSISRTLMHAKRGRACVSKQGYAHNVLGAIAKAPARKGEPCLSSCIY